MARTAQETRLGAGGEVGLGQGAVFEFAKRIQRACEDVFVWLVLTVFFVCDVLFGDKPKKV